MHLTSLQYLGISIKKDEIFPKVSETSEVLNVIQLKIKVKMWKILLLAILATIVRESHQLHTGSDIPITNASYVVAIKVGGITQCSGAILNAKSVITNCDCTQKGTDPILYSDYEIVYGLADVTAPTAANIATVVQVSCFPSDPATDKYNLAMIQTTPMTLDGVNSNFIRVIKGSSKFSKPSGGRTYGFGNVVQGGPIRNKLMSVRIKIQYIHKCTAAYPTMDGPSTFCAGLGRKGVINCESMCSDPKCTIKKYSNTINSIL